MIELPNFDAMTLDELLDWLNNEGTKPYLLAELMFPGEKYRRRTCKRLKEYVENAIYARMQRLEGNIEVAKRFEDLCDVIYKGLPDYAKW